MVVICDKVYPPEQEAHYQEHFSRFPFPLSDFQKYSIQAIVDGNHTLVSAATGNGKTVSADFAIQYFVGQGKKVVYTCPIKSLSNQKFYDFSQKYPEISFGIFTGDVKYNPTAQVIFATAEILMNHLFSRAQASANTTTTTPSQDPNRDITLPDGTPLPPKHLQFQVDIDHELACVVMDECHFILDEDRGHVWENTILMLPPHVQMVLLSATLDQPERFARFCERGQAKQVVWSSTMTRIVPLTHYGFMTTIESIYKKVRDKDTQAMIRNTTNRLIPLKTEKGLFQDTGYNEMKKIQTLLDNNQVYLKRQHVLNTLARFMVEKEMLPALVFTFSRKNVEMCAREMTTNLLEFDSKVPYTIQREAEQILRSKLPNYQEYMEMPEYRQLIQLLEKGIGIHHSGMIPILREIVEFMISKRYIKMLFATDSFSIGLNCEIRTVVFTTLQKFDGTLETYLQPHAYTQMAGRAGRRNIDTVGHVVHCNNLFPLPSVTDYKTILCGKPQKMESKFHISFSMILNLIRHGQATPADFYRFVENSMMSMDMAEARRALVTQRTALEQEWVNTETRLLPLIQTPVPVIEQYLETKRTLPTLVNKKRKEAERTLQQILDTHRTCIQDTERYGNMTLLRHKLDRINQEMDELDRWVHRQIDAIVDILTERGFITPTSDESPRYELTPRGGCASQMAEVHPLATAEWMFEYQFFEEFTPLQLIAMMSCFTDLRVHQDVVKYRPTVHDPRVVACVTDLKSRLDGYDQEEATRGLNTGFRYQHAVMYDLMEEMFTWMECEDEATCKHFIQHTILEEKQVTSGDFVKAVLKISAVAKEWVNVGETIGKYGFVSKLNQVDRLILKYVCTTQSLYV
jgi:hypothetical protein